MANKSAIEWTTTVESDGSVSEGATWNPVRGCSLVSAGCKNCYAMHVAARFIGPRMPYEGLITKTSQGAKWNGKIKLSPEMLNEVMYWARPRKIFVNSMSDLFHEDVPVEFIDQIFVVMALANQHTYQILTKRPERMREYCNGFNWKRAVANCRHSDGSSLIDKHTMQALMQHFRLETGLSYADKSAFPLPNVWLGVSVEDQTTAVERIAHLLQTPAAIRWISAEPLLGPVNLIPYLGGRAIQCGCGFLETESYLKGVSTNSETCLVCRKKTRSYPTLDWVVLGGESGAQARPMHPAWAKKIMEDCTEIGVPFFFKQWGEWGPEDSIGMVSGDRLKHLTIEHDGIDAVMVKRGKKKNGRRLFGKLHDGYPSPPALAKSA